MSLIEVTFITDEQEQQTQDDSMVEFMMICVGEGE